MTTPDLSHAEWRTSSYSGANGSCVEVAPVPGAASAAVESTDTIAVRDSKDRRGPSLVVEPGMFAAFTRAIKNGEFE